MTRGEPEATHSIDAAATDVESGPIEWTPEWRARCPAFRGFAGPPLPAEVSEVWTELRRRRLSEGFSSEERSLLGRLGLSEELLHSETPPATDEADKDARYFALLPYRELIDFLVLRGGLQHAFAALLAALLIQKREKSSENPGLVDDFGFWLRLRRHLLAAPPELYAALRSQAETIRQLGWTLRNGRIAMLFPDEPWAAADAARALGSFKDPFELVHLVGLIVDAGSLAASGQLIRKTPGYAIRKWLGHGLVPGLLVRYGTAAIPLIDDLLEKELELAHLESYSDDWRNELLAGLAGIKTREALSGLLDRAEEQAARVLLRNSTFSHPDFGLTALAETIGRSGKNSAIARALLRSLAKAHPEKAAAALAKANPNAAGVLRVLIGELTCPLVWAAESAWPEVLRRPPWEGAKKRAPSAADARLRLELAAYPEAWTWQGGEREAWLAKDPGPSGLQMIPWHQSALAAIRAELVKGLQDSTQPGINRYLTLYLLNLDLAEAVALWKKVPAGHWETWMGGPEAFLAKAELKDVIEGLLDYTAAHAADLSLLLPADSPRIAPRMAMLIRRRRKQRHLAASWLRRHPRAAAIGLIPPALGTAADQREDAEEGLRFLAREGFADEVLARAADYGVGGPIAALLSRDPLELLPAKIPKIAEFEDAASLPPLRLKSGEALPPPALSRLQTMLAFSRTDRPYEGLRQVREACDPNSLAAWVWALFECWLAAGAEAKEQWALLALGHFGDDGCARRLAPLLRGWSERKTTAARAVAGLEVFTLIGSDVTLMLLQNVADRVKVKTLKESARRKIEELAEQKGLSAEELADRLAPDLGLDENGSLELDFGPRRFRVGFDEQLRPMIFDAEGKLLAQLPRAGKTDNAAHAAAAIDRYKALKADAQNLAGLQIQRLERAMLAQRRLPREIFETFFANHPLIRHLARRLVWAAHEGEETFYFRIAEDGTLTDAADRGWNLPAAAEVSVPHPLLLPPAVAAGFGQLFADYELLQPFPQLGREVHTLTEAEKAQHELRRFAGRVVSTGRILALKNHGWRRGAPNAGDLSTHFERELAGKRIYLTFHQGIGLENVFEFPTQTLDEVSVARSPLLMKELTLGALSPIEASEILRELGSLIS